MALSPQLLQYKSSGVYRLEFDKSQTVNIPAETIRLVVGHSKKGPYNTPVLVETTEQFINVFGSIDRNLEKRGMFFHRSALAALTRGPILALNTASFDAADLINYVAAPTAGGDATAAIIEGDSAYYNYFNTEKFWTPSDEAVNSVVGTAANNLLRFINIKQDNITVFVRKAQSVKSFDITAREWYGEGNVPAYLNDFDLMSDFMVDVFVFKGSFDPADMNTDPIYGEFFTAEGLDSSKLGDFANLRQVSLMAQYTGSLLPGFMDLEGNQLYLESMINAEARRTGLFCAVNEDLVTDDAGTGIDLVGHVYDSGLDYNLLSYKIDNTNPTSPQYAASVVTLPAIGDDTINPVLTALSTTVVPNDTVTFTNLAAAGGIVGGDFLLDAAGTGYVEVLVSAAGVVTCAGEINASYGGLDTTLGAIDINKYTEFFITGASPRHYAVDAGFAYDAATELFATYTAPTASLLALSLSVGDYIKAASGRMTKITRIIKDVVGANDVYSVYTIEAPMATGSYEAFGYKSYEAASLVYVPFLLDGATVADQSIADCLNAVGSSTGLGNALADKDNITYRYIVDTFGSYDAGTLLNKVQLSSLAKNRQNASAILNAPFIKDFKASTNPSFVDANGAFNVNYVATGGNLDNNPSALYALPGINDGANYAFYYGPGLIVRENNKDIVVPPAAYVSNNFIDKYTDSLPWAIVAGPRRGVVSGPSVVGAEYAFDKSDRDVLEPFGYNPIVFQRGVGLTILGNKTAQQSVQSALSSAHVREVLIYIQDGLAAILKNYVFEFNTAQTRLEIKTLADSFLESVKADFGVYDYKNVMDTTNNTNDVIDANMGIIDTYVEPVKGLEIVVHRTTVLNTGEIATGNFS